MRRTLIICFALSLLGAPTAMAGGWATAGLSSTPDGVAPGETWKVDIEILQHGRTPMTGIEPAVIIEDAAGKETRFDGEETKKAGIYTAAVVFPKAGRYTYTVDDGFTNAVPHTFPAVLIGTGGERDKTAVVPLSGAEGSGGGGGGTPWWPFALVGGVLLAAMAGFTLRRRGATGPATA